MRYFEATAFRTKPATRWSGKRSPNLCQQLWQGGSDAHWATYEEMYGHNSGGVYVVFVPYKWLAEVDADGKQLKEYVLHPRALAAAAA